MTGDILLKSRKRDLTYAFTSQILGQVNKRVRQVLDFMAYPMLNPEETIVKMSIFRSGNASPSTYMKTIYFKTSVFFDLYDTREEISPMMDESDVPFKPVFQADKDSEIIMFESWEDADKYAEKYWNEKYKNLKNMI